MIVILLCNKLVNFTLITSKWEVISMLNIIISIRIHFNIYAVRRSIFLVVMSK